MASCEACNGREMQFVFATAYWCPGCGCIETGDGVRKYPESMYVVYQFDCGEHGAVAYKYMLSQRVLVLRGKTFEEHPPSEVAVGDWLYFSEHHTTELGQVKKITTEHRLKTSL